MKTEEITFGTPVRSSVVGLAPQRVAAKRTMGTAGDFGIQ